MVEDDLLLSAAQTEIVLFEMLNPGTPTYNVPVVLRLSGPLSVPGLRAALHRTTARHPALRMRIEIVAGRPVGRVRDRPDVCLVVHPGDVPARRPCELRDCLRRPFDVAVDPLLRAELWPLSPSEHLLAMVAHHLILDARSLEILLEDLTSDYAAAVAGTEPSVEPAAHRDRWDPAEPTAADVEWWRHRLQQLPPPSELSSDRPPSTVSDHAGERIEFAVDTDLGDRIADRAQEMRVTEHVLLLASFAALLSRVVGSDHLVIGSPFANRDDHGTARRLGFFSNTLPVVIDLSGADLTLAGLVDRVRDAVYGALDHQSVPLDRIVREVAPSRRAGDHPFFRVLFAHQQTSTRALEVAGLSARTLPVSTGTAKLDLTLLTRRDHARGPLGGSLEYRIGQFDRTAAGALVADFTAILTRYADDPRCALRPRPRG